MGNKCAVNVVLQNNRILACLTEHIDVLALLNLICYIEDGSLLRLFLLGVFFVLFFGFCGFLSLCLGILFRLLVLLDAVFQSEIFAVNVLEKNIVIHLVCKLAVLDAAIFDKWADVIPVFLIGLTVCLAHSGKLVCNLLGDVLGNLLYKSIILQGRSGYVQRQIRAVDHTFEKKQELRNNLFNIICNKYLVVVQLNGSLNGIVLCIDLREIQDTFQVERVIHVQMDPEQRLLVVHEYLAVEFLVFLICAAVRMLHPQRLRVT